MLGTRGPATSNAPLLGSEGHQMQRAARKWNAADDDEQQHGHAASPHHADASSQPGTGMLGKPGQTDGTPYADQAVAGRPASPDAPSQQGGSQLSDICLPSSSFDLPRFDAGQAGQAEGETCWPMPNVTQAPHPTLPLPPRAGSLPPRRSNESNASSGHENLLRSNAHGATSRHNHAPGSEYLQRAPSMHVRNFTPGYILTQDQPQPQGLSYTPSSMPSQQFDGIGAMTGGGPEGMHHAEDEHWPAQKPTLPWDRQERLGANDTTPTADDIDYVSQMLDDVYDPNSMSWPQGQYMLGDSSQHLNDLRMGHGSQPSFVEGYMGVSSDAPGGNGNLTQHTMSGSSAGLSHASVLPPNLPVGGALPPLALGGASPCSLEAGNTTPTTMLPAADAMFLTGMYDVMDTSPNQAAAGGMHGVGVVPDVGALDDATGSGGGGSGLIGMQAGCNSMDASKTSMTRLQASSLTNPSPSSPISAAPQHPAAAKTTPTSSQPSNKRSRRDADTSFATQAEAAGGPLGTRRAHGAAEESSGLSPNKKSMMASSNHTPSATASPTASKPPPGTPKPVPTSSKLGPVSAFSVPNLKFDGGTEGDSHTKRAKHGVSPRVAAQIVGPTGLGKSAAETLLATLPKPTDAISPLLNATAKGRDALMKGNTKALLDLLTPTHMELAPRKPRRGGGRTSQADPRLMDPDMDDKKARRIVANRLSAARSKMRQRQLAEQVEQEHMALEQHKARLACTISELTQKVTGLEAENDSLKQRITQLEAERNKAMAQVNRGPAAVVSPGNDAKLVGQQQQRPVSKFSIGGTQTAALGLGGIPSRWHHPNLPASGNTGGAQPAAGTQPVFPLTNMAESMPSMTTLAGAAQQGGTPRMGAPSPLPPGLLSNMGPLSRQPSLLPNQPTVLRSASGLAMDTPHPMYPEPAYPEPSMSSGRHGLTLQASNLPCPPTTMPPLNLQESSYPTVPPLGAPGHGLMLGPESAHMSEWVPGMPTAHGHHRMPPGSTPRGYPPSAPLLHQPGWGMKSGGPMGMDRPCALALDDSLVHMPGGIAVGGTHQHSASNSTSMTQGGLPVHDGATIPGINML